MSLRNAVRHEKRNYSFEVEGLRKTTKADYPSLDKVVDAFISVIPMFIVYAIAAFIALPLILKGCLWLVDILSPSVADMVSGKLAKYSYSGFKIQRITSVALSAVISLKMVYKETKK